MGRDTILRLAREKGSIIPQGNSLVFFPDFTVVVQATRREFGAVKKFLQVEGVPYAMLYPARLRIGSVGNSKIFSNPRSALEHAKHLKRQKHAPNTQDEAEEQ